MVHHSNNCSFTGLVLSVTDSERDHCDWHSRVLHYHVSEFLSVSASCSSPSRLKPGHLLFSISTKTQTCNGWIFACSIRASGWVLLLKCETCSPPLFTTLAFSPYQKTFSVLSLLSASFLSTSFDAFFKDWNQTEDEFSISHGREEIFHIYLHYDMWFQDKQCLRSIVVKFLAQHSQLSDPLLLEYWLENTVKCRMRETVKVVGRKERSVLVDRLVYGAERVLFFFRIFDVCSWFTCFIKGQ